MKKLIGLVDQNISCFGNNDGRIEASVIELDNNSKVNGVEYTLKRHGGVPTVTNNHGVFMGLKPGTYYLTAVDSLKQRVPVELKSYTVKLRVTTPKKLGVRFSTKKGNILSITITGGHAILQPHLVTWYKHTGTKKTKISTDAMNMETVMVGLAPGLYSVEIEDDNGCFFTSEPYELI